SPHRPPAGALGGTGSTAAAAPEPAEARRGAPATGGHAHPAQAAPRRTPPRVSPARAVPGRRRPPRGPPPPRLPVAPVRARHSTPDPGRRRLAAAGRHPRDRAPGADRRPAAGGRRTPGRLPGPRPDRPAPAPASVQRAGRRATGRTAGESAAELRRLRPGIPRARARFLPRVPEKGAKGRDRTIPGLCRGAVLI